jgi:hypothetical protein
MLWARDVLRNKLGWYPVWLFYKPLEKRGDAEFYSHVGPIK